MVNVSTKKNGTLNERVKKRLSSIFAEDIKLFTDIKKNYLLDDTLDI